MDSSIFVKQLSDFVDKESQLELLNLQSMAINCIDLFNSDPYLEEKKIIDEIFNNKKLTIQQKGSYLENLAKLLFSRCIALDNIQITHYDTEIGQIDIILPIMNDIVFDILNVNPSSIIIGECKNYTKNDGKAPKEDIEKVCWRTCKSGALSIFISHAYTQGAVDEISNFNANKENYIIKHKQSLIVPITISMIKVVIDNNFNFGYFLKWCCLNSKIISSINNYLSPFDDYKI